MFRRWKFTDPLGVKADWSFPVSPNRMDPPSIEDTVDISIAGAKGNHDVPTPTAPKDWTWSGVLHTLDELDTMESWASIGRTVYVTTHFGDQFAVQVRDIDAKRGGTTQHPERHTYTAHVLLLRQTARRTA